MISDLTHRLLDLAEEDYRVQLLKEEPRGSTGRGISAAYSEETGHWQMYFSDFLAGPNYFARKLAQRADRACRTIQHVYQVSEATWNSFFEQLTAAEQRANAEAIDSAFSSRTNSISRSFAGREPFTLDLRAADRGLLAGRNRPGPQHRRGARADPARAAGRPHHHRRIRPGLLAGQAARLFPTSPLPHLHSGIFRERRTSRCSRIHTFGVAKAYDTKVGTHTFLTQMDEADIL